MSDKHIIWREVDHISQLRGHGIELWYEFDKTFGRDSFSGKMLVAFVYEYGWLHGSGTPVKVVYHTIPPTAPGQAGVATWTDLLAPTPTTPPATYKLRYRAYWTVSDTDAINQFKANHEIANAAGDVAKSPQRVGRLLFVHGIDLV